MKVQEFYDKELSKYNLLNLIDPATAKQAMQMMEEYHQAKLKLLGIGDVVGQSEQFICYKADIGNSRCSSQCRECGENECINK